MFKKTLLILLSGFTCLIFSSSVYIVSPDPALFAKSFLEIIKKNNAEIYIETYKTTDADIDWLLNAIQATPYLTENELSSYKRELSNKTEFANNVNKDLNSSIANIQYWIKTDSIAVNSIEIVDCFYGFQQYPIPGFCKIKSTQIFVKHKSKYYLIMLDDFFYINNHWRGGDVNEIKEVKLR